MNLSPLQSHGSMPEVYDAIPEAYDEFESLRGLGYEPKEAIADLIDNSIKAEADEIRVTLFWSAGKSWIAIRDNGEGFTPKSMQDAMTLYKKDPQRKKSDLGQFGMGLKTASISMGRRLTVIAKNTDDTKDTLVSVLDLEHQKKENYQILGKLQKEEQKIVDDNKLLHGMSQGTCVLITDLDLLLEKEQGRSSWTEKQMLALSEKIERHLGMIFHRFIEGVDKKIKIYISPTSKKGNLVAPWDPFSKTYLSSPRAIQMTTRVSGEQAKYKGYILKSKKDIAGKYEEAGGPDGWLAHQGFYIYRRNRMLVYGSWLGLRDMNNRKIQKNPAHNLVRIELDLSDNLARQWKVDIMKTKVEPPNINHLELRRSASQLMKEGRQALFGKTNIRRRNQPDYPDLWKISSPKQGGIRTIKLRVNKSHPLIKSLKEDLVGVDKKKLALLVELLSSSVPTNDLLLEMQGEDREFSPEPLTHDDQAYIDALIGGGLRENQARAILNQYRGTNDG